MGKIIPDYDHDDRNHSFIWDCLAHELNKEDFEAIQLALIEREDSHSKVDETKVQFVKFDDKMMQPRDVPDEWKEHAHHYIDWDCAMKIWLILSKYADFYSKG